MAALLKVESITSGYGGVAVLHDVSIEVGDNEIVAVVGANGAGKSTLLLTISGHITAKQGRVTFDGRDITREKAYRMVGHHFAMVPEGGRLFPFMSVRENLELGAYHAVARRNLRANLDEVLTLFPILADRRHQLAGRLSGGERQICAIARAMMSEPRLLMLDEPSLGLAPIMVEKVFELVDSLARRKGMAILLVEQNVADAFAMSRRAYIMERGEIVKTGTGRELLGDEDVRRAYLGV
ncbi:MAG: ABC transporter ATP-binding protein [Acetobacteraceae bacterium]